MLLAFERAKNYTNRMSIEWTMMNFAKLEILASVRYVLQIAIITATNKWQIGVGFCFVLKKHWSQRLHCCWKYDFKDVNDNRLRNTYVNIFISKNCQRERRIESHRQGISKSGNFIGYSTHGTLILPKQYLTCYHYLPKKEIPGTPWKQIQMWKYVKLHQLKFTCCILTEIFLFVV